MIACRGVVDIEHDAVGGVREAPAEKRRPTFGSWLQLQIGKTKRRIQIRTSDPNAKEDNKERWFSLGPKDIVAREIGTLCLSDERLPRGVREGWPQRYQATGIGRMKSKQTFAIETPKGSPWPGWTHLFVDPMAGIGPNSYVVAIPSAAMTSNALARGKQILGPVSDLNYQFTVTDIKTGRRVKITSRNRSHPLFGPVVGMSRSI